ncbi:uncharacterized protein C8orf58 homolog isoform X2 [Alligator sinensis]|uniref:Uncharacterized protein C8orf58 homolog isoform X2 n=1 Tax=Alligator sinensis TaxID=38654 RepID=A0A1U8D9F9_ALLSI|nr:uncharacterized protein C8orf58 homolog isoform X2 [Alligator sinensis]
MRAGDLKELLHDLRQATEECFVQDRAGGPMEGCVVLTSASMYRKLQETWDPPAGARPGGEMSGEQDPWDRAESPTEPGPVRGLSASLGFFPKSGQLLKSESEDSGVEMASNEHSPSTPLGSESSFSLDGLDGFQPCADDPAGSNPEESRSGAAGLGQPDTLQERDCQRSLSASVKLAQVLQRSRKHRMAGRSARQLSRSKRSQEGAEPYGLQQPGSQGGIAGTVEEHSQAPSGHHSPEAGSPEPCGDRTEGPRDPGLTLPGQGLRYLEHVCQMLERIAQLQKANLRLQQQQAVMESRLRSQEPKHIMSLVEGPCRAPEEQAPMSDPAPGSGLELEMQEEDMSLAPWRPHPFRARSSSDTGTLWDLSRSAENDPAPFRKAAGHSCSSPSLLDQSDRGACTLPPGMRPQSNLSQWGKVKVLITRIARKSPRGSEEAVGGRRCRAEATLEKHVPHPARTFLPGLSVKKHRAKTLSVR